MNGYPGVVIGVTPHSKNTAAAPASFFPNYS